MYLVMANLIVLVMCQEFVYFRLAADYVPKVLLFIDLKSHAVTNQYVIQKIASCHHFFGTVYY